MRRKQETFQSTRSEGAVQRERERDRRRQRLIPLLIFGAIALMIAKHEIPAVDGWISRLLDADAWSAGEACRRAALGQLEQPDFARLLKQGKVEKTQGGYYIGEILYSVLEPTGEEQRYRYSCNVTATGEVVTINRRGYAAGDASEGFIERTGSGAGNIDPDG